MNNRIQELEKEVRYQDDQIEDLENRISDLENFMHTFIEAMKGVVNAS